MQTACQWPVAPRSVLGCKTDSLAHPYECLLIARSGHSGRFVFGFPSNDDGSTRQPMLNGAQAGPTVEGMIERWDFGISEQIGNLLEADPSVFQISKR